jgi:hypothetical protein
VPWSGPYSIETDSRGSGSEKGAVDAADVLGNIEEVPQDFRTFPILIFLFIFVQYRVYKETRYYEIWFLECLLECKYKDGGKLQS